MKFSRLAALVAGLAVVAARADIAATRYVGHGITPVEAPGIRMVSAKVDIDWGEPGTLSAVFVMNNDAARAAEVQLGFPVSLPEVFRKKSGLDFTMAFDGVPTDCASIRQDTPAKNSFGSPAATLWFHCRHLFPPGATTVKVETRLPATVAYHLPYREDLLYCVQTGAAWKGKIGSEEIAIHFPRPLQAGEIVRCGPASGTVKGNTVRWRFENFKPKKWDHDIFLQFLDPDVMPILAALRRQAARDPGNLRKRLNLIKHLLALDSVRNSFPEPPVKMSRDEYRELLAMLRSDEDRTRFRALYARSTDEYNRQENFNPTKENSHAREESSRGIEDEDEMTSLLSAVGYVPRGGRSEFLTEGRNRLARLLKEHPRYADAWNVYLLHTIGIPGTLGIYPFELKETKTALRNCPNDPSIRLWDIAGRLERQRQSERDPSITPLAKRAFMEENQLRRELEKRGIADQYGGFAVRYSHRSADYF